MRLNILQGSIGMEHPKVTVSERLQIAIRFAQANLNTLRPGDWLNLRNDLAIFLGCKAGEQSQYPAAGGVMGGPDIHPEDDKFTEDAIRALQEEMRRLLQGAVDRIPLEAPAVPIQGLFSIMFSSQGTEKRIVGYGPTRDMTLVTLLFLLDPEHLDRIRKCPECNSIFYRIAKQQYCSRPCTNRANLRNWRQREGVREEEREEAHRRYKEKQPKNTQKQVTRRPRKRLPT
jgi:hypothetical protein